MKKLFILISLISYLTTASFAKDVKSLIVDELEVFIQKNIIIVDIRDKSKWKQTGIIPNSYRITYTSKDEKKWVHTLIRLIKDKNRAFVLISKDGKKAEKLASKLYNKKKMRNAMYLEGGIDEWVDSDRKIINY